MTTYPAAGGARRSVRVGVAEPTADALPSALTKNNLVFGRPQGRNLLARTSEFHSWLGARRDMGLWPYATALHQPPSPQTRISAADGVQRSGINFASQDYLSLTRHPRVRESAIAALQEYGPHSAGSAVLQGNTELSRQLEQDLAEALRTEHVVLFPTGWGAGFGAVVSLVRPGDLVIMDELAHACLQSGANAATPNVIRHKHLEIGSIETILKEVKARGHQNGILVITEGLFSMDADMPQFGTLQDACHEHDATLLVDVAHDFGSMGPNGEGALGMQGLLGKVDLVMGSFSKTFASNGGFVASHSAAVRDYMTIYGGPHTFSNALSPVQAAVVHACLKIVRSPEGEQRRRKMLNIASHLRDGLTARGIQCLGDPSPIVPALVGNEALSRLASRRMQQRNVLANLVEFPAVPVNGARFRLQVMADHSEEQATAAAEAVAWAIEQGRADLERIRVEDR